MIYRLALASPTFRSALVWLLTLGWCLTPAAVHAQPRRDRDNPDAIRTNGPKVLAAFRDVVALPSRSTVLVRSAGKDVALGTIVGADGWIVSKYSELKNPITCMLREGRELSAQIIGVHEGYDLVMLKVDAKDLKPVVWGDINSAAVGNFVATPSTGSDPIAVGVVSVKVRKVGTRDQPVVNANSGYLGVSLEPSELGVKIAQILPNSAAAKAGFKVNDAIVSVAGKMVTDPDALITTIQRYKVGDIVTLKVKRGDEEVEIKATLGKRPSGDRGDFQNRLGNEMSNRRGGFPSILQHDTVLKPKECGGPLVDLDGKTVGINIARAGRTETYAVPADAVIALLADLKSGKLLPAELREAALAEALLVKIEAAKAVVAKAEAQLKEALRKVENAPKPALEKAEAELKESRKRLQEARNTLDKLDNEAKPNK